MFSSVENYFVHVWRISFPSLIILYFYSATAKWPIQSKPKRRALSPAKAPAQAKEPVGGALDRKRR